ncbi:hypothetical protein K1719_003131 [Acacia pycnantha]|nr:hypothetical protein K1719_003131 [Acacia pycnantha]
MMRGQQDQQSRMLYELSTLVLNILRSSPAVAPISLPDHPSALPPSRLSPSLSQITPAGFASLLLGISVSLMLCGSVTFFLGFFLMPWVFGLVMLLYVAGIVSALKMLGRSILCFATSPEKPRKEIPAWKVL